MSTNLSVQTVFTRIADEDEEEPLLEFGTKWKKMESSRDDVEAALKDPEGFLQSLQAETAVANQSSSAGGGGGANDAFWWQSEGAQEVERMKSAAQQIQEFERWG